MNNIFSYPFADQAAFDSFWHCFDNLTETVVMDLNANFFVDSIRPSAKIYYLTGNFNRDWKLSSGKVMKADGRRYSFQIGCHQNHFGKFTNCDMTYFLKSQDIHIPSNFSEPVEPKVSQVEFDPKGNSFELIEAMIQGLRSFDGKNLKSMNMKKYWDSEKMRWLGPWSIGHLNGLSEFETHHQIPFLEFIPDRTGAKGKNKLLFSEGNYAASMGFPSLVGTHKGEYFGFEASHRQVAPFVMDFWSCTDEQIVDNWVQIDMLAMWKSINEEFDSYTKSIFSF